MTASPEENDPSLRAGVGKTEAIRVLFVENDPYYRENLVDELSDHGFAVRSFADGASLLDSLDAAADADVIILDWSLPETPGIDLLPQLRRHGVNLPVVFVTGQALPAHESLAFDVGAIDFIDKARGVEVLVRRLKCAVGAGKPAARSRTDKRVVCGKLVLRSNVSRAYWDKIDVGLTVGEYNIVHLLVSNVGRYVTYRAIYDRVHYEGFIAGTGNYGYRANVRSAIKRIRNKLREVDSTFVEIENYPAFGYCWTRPEKAGLVRPPIAEEQAVPAERVVVGPSLPMPQKPASISHTGLSNLRKARRANRSTVHRYDGG